MMNLRNLYLYAVSFVTLLMTLSGVVATASQLIDFALPTTYAYNYDYNYAYPYTGMPEYAEDGTELTTEEQKAQEEKRIAEQTAYQEQYQAEQRGLEQKNSLKSACKSFVLVLVSAPMFLLHWKKIQAERV